MASVFTNNAEGTDGALVTISSTTGGTQWDTIVRGTTGILEYDTAQKISGSTSIKFGSTADADRGHVLWSSFSPNTTQKMVARFYAYFTSFKTNNTFFSVQEADSTRVMSLALQQDGVLFMDDTSSDAAVRCAGTLSFGTWYRFEVLIDLTVPILTVKTYLGHGTTHDPTLSISITPATATDLIERVMFGKYSTAANSNCWFWLDEMAVSTDITTPIGPLSGGATVHYDIEGNYTADSTTFTGWTIDATSSVGTTTLTQQSGPTATIVQSPTNIYTVTNPAATGDIVLRLTATSGGSVSSDITLVRTAAGGGTVTTVRKPYRWTYSGTAPVTSMANWK